MTVLQLPFKIISCLIAVGRTFDTMLNKMVKVGILILFLILEEMPSAFHLLSMMLAVGLESVAFDILRYVASIPTLLKVFIINAC